ncbi:uncharacterized protein TNCV_4555731 [Trichonephila clavipes]|nr:uncharacterized protein TNCV_4555731 [Trichonephila clavipes]
MPPNTLRVHMEYVLVKSVGPKSCGLSHDHRDWRIFPSIQFKEVIMEVGIGGVAIYRPFGEFRRAKSYCHLYGAQGQRQVYFQPLAAMNFVGLDLTTSDRWHYKQQQQQSALKVGCHCVCKLELQEDMNNITVKKPSMHVINILLFDWFSL